VLLIRFFLPETVKASGMLPATHALALYLFCWGFFTLYMWFASFRVSVAVNLVFLTVWIACVLLAWYTAAAHAINGTLGRTIVPVVPLAR
jgi:succinate-acetate transporter protein